VSKLTLMKKKCTKGVKKSYFAIYCIALRGSSYVKYTGSCLAAFNYEKWDTQGATCCFTSLA